MTNRLTDKVVIVTGGARGQGAAHGRVFAEEGATVILADLLDEAGQETASQLRDKGLSVEYRHLDVTSEAAWQELADSTVATYGHVDGLVSNAGIFKAALPQEESLDDLVKIFRINAGGAFLGSKVVAEAMKASGGGSIVNIASVNAHRGTPGSVSYAASKAAVVNITKSLAVAYADYPVRVNSVSPGWLKAPMLEEKADPRAATDWRLQSTIGSKTLVRADGGPRGAAPEEISAALLFLLSDEASFVTGSDILVDGGALAW